MIPLAEINNKAMQYQVPIEAIEKDYVISWILHCLSLSSLKDDFIFYGGTAIKRMYFEDHRFSEDIDLLFSKRINTDTLLEKLKIIEKAYQETNLVLRIKANSIVSSKNRLQLLINYDGYDEISGAPKEIRLDFSMNMDLFGDTESTSMIESYSDLIDRKTTLNVMTLNTILAAKLGLLTDITRNEPRDLYDIWFLLNRNDEFELNVALVNKAFKEKYGYVPLFSILSTKLNNISYNKNWHERLSKQVHALPDLEEVRYQITTKLKHILPS